VSRSARWHYRRIRKRYGVPIVAFIVSVVVILMGHYLFGAMGLISSLGLAIGPDHRPNQ
jgi:hypothetical protein